jgi:hypothetical protein
MKTKKFPDKIFVTVDSPGKEDEVLSCNGTLENFALIGQKVRAAEYKLVRVIEVLGEATITTEIGQ